jgi:beta-N-acetylhexosaminidase
VYRRRRRTAAAALVVVAAAISLGLDGVLGDTASEPGPARIERLYLGAVPERALIGQKLMVRMDGAATPRLVRQAREGEVGGVIVFPPPGQPVGELRREIERLQDAAREGGRPRLLVAIDQEGGEVKRLPQGPPEDPPARLGAGGAARARSAGSETGRYLARLGINLDLAPVLDVPSSSSSFISTRAFGDEPRDVAAAGVAFARGLERGGVIPAVKHFPGLGKAVANTDLEPSEIDASRRELDADLDPFREAIAAGVPMVMVGHAIYDAFDPERPAALSPAIAEDLLRAELGFDGVVISDDLGAGAVLAQVSERDAPVAAARAGVDILLFAGTDDARTAFDAMREALDRGGLSRASLEASLARILELKDRL